MDLREEGIIKVKNDTYVGSYYIDGEGRKIRDGEGRYSFTNGDKYEGNWKDGKMNGKGIYYFKDGNKYEGNWKDGKFSLLKKAPKKQAYSKVIVFNFYKNETSATDLKKYTSENAEIHKLSEAITPDYIEQFAFPEINNTSISKLVFNCHGNKNGTNELGIEKSTAKLMLQKIIDIGSTKISISDHSCYGSIGRAFAEAFQELSKDNKTKNVTLNVINASNNKAIIDGHSRTFCINEEGKVEFRQKQIYYEDISSNNIINIDLRKYNNNDFINNVPAMKSLSMKNDNISLYEKKVDSFWNKIKSFFLNLCKNIKGLFHNSTQTSVTNREEKYKIQPQSQAINVNFKVSSEKLHQDRSVNREADKQQVSTRII